MGKRWSHVECYRVNYEPEGWHKFAEQHGQFCVIIGAVDAIRWLCDRVETLEGAMRKAKVEAPSEWE